MQRNVPQLKKKPDILSGAWERPLLTSTELSAWKSLARVNGKFADGLEMGGGDWRGGEGGGGAVIERGERENREMVRRERAVKRR